MTEDDDSSPLLRLHGAREYLLLSYLDLRGYPGGELWVLDPQGRNKITQWGPQSRDGYMLV